MDTFVRLLFPVGFFGGLFIYPFLQYFALRRMCGGWRILAFLPLVPMCIVLIVMIQGLLQQSNLWPILFIFFAPLALVYLAILFACHKVMHPIANKSNIYMTKISSTSTQFYKKVLPLFWFGFLTFFIIGLIRGRIYEKAPIALLVPFMGVFFGFFIMKKLVWDLADEVYDCGKFLFVKNSGMEERVELSNIMNVSASTYTNPQRITLKLVCPGQFGAEISFSPTTPFIINPFAKNKIAEDLIVRVDQARTLRQALSDSEGMNSNIAVQNADNIECKNEFSLEKNTAALAALFIMASMLIYALVDTVFINLYEVVGYPENKLLLMVLSAMPICLLGFVIHGYMIRSSVPERESLVLTILCVLSLAIAAHPLLQRIDKILASKPMQTYNYRMIKPGVFEPIEVGPPELNLRTQCEYWQQYTKNDTLQFSLQHGGLGMWQLDGEALDRDIYVYLKKLHPSNFIGNFRIK